MASTMISVNLPENSQDSSQSALELLRPDPPLEQKAEAKIQDAGEEDELEALRMAAIASMRPKKSSYKVQAHPVRSNLLSIVPVEDQPELKPKLFSAVILPNKRNSESPGKNTTSKFNRHNDENNESSDLSSSEEEIEVEEEVTATESESEEQSTTKKGEEESSKTAATEAPSGVVKKQISIEPDDVLKIDCTDEVDEFTNFLNEFEDDLKSPAVTAEGQANAAANNKGGPKPKKTKIILVKKKVKKNRNQGSKAPLAGARSRSQRSRSPNMRRRSRSPRRRRTPPRGGRYSPYRRSPSPYRRRRYSRSPSPRGRYRPRSRSPRSYRSPPRRPMRRSRSPTSPQRRGGSAPRHMIRSRSGSREKSPNNKKEGDPKQDKSKSLPPSRVDSQNGGKKNSSNKQSAEEKAAHEAEEKLKKLPTPEREKLLQRRKKFEGNIPVQSVAGKKISLKRAAETNVAFDNNGQSVDDTNEDMFEHDEDIEDHQPLPAKNRRQASKAPTEPLTKVVTDLRVQLHKKRQQQQKTAKIVEPEIVFKEALPEYESDVDSLENARVTSSDEEEIVQTTISRKKIGITSSGNSSSNRLVTKSGIKGSPRRVGFNQELPTKRTYGQRSVMSRLGAKVSDDSEEENSKKRGKIVISDSGEEDQDDCLTPPETETAISLSKKEKKAEKERKKAEKKKKKEKKKEKKKSKKQRSSSSEPEMPIESAGKGSAMVAENSEDDELMNFFENLDSEDILLEKMKKKNDVLNARHKKIEADKKLHS